MKRLLITLLLLANILYAGIEEIQSGQEIKLDIDGKYKVVKLPAYSSIFYYTYEGNDFHLLPDMAGEYIIEIEEKDTERTFVKEYLVKSNKEYKESEIYAIIEEALSKGEVDRLEGALDDIFENNPYDSKLIDYLGRYMDYLLDKGLKKEAFELYKVTSFNYKYSKSQAVKILDKIYESSHEDDNLDMKVLQLLSSMDESYKEKLTLLELKNNIEVEKNLEILVNDYRKTMDKNIAKILADYYMDKEEFGKAERYLKAVDKGLLAVEYLKRNDNVKFEYIVSTLSDEEIEKVEEGRKAEEDKKKMRLYLDKARLNARSERYQMADIYYKRVIKQSKDEEQVKDAMLALGKMYFEERKLTDSLTVYNTYMKEFGNAKDAEVRYSLGIIYYDLKKFAESDKMFNQIVLLYPRTVWATRASIYKLKIKNKGDGNES